MRRSALLSALTVLPLLGSVIGVWLTLEAGVACVDAEDESSCGRNFVVWTFSSPIAIGLSAALGAVVGMVLYAIAALMLMRRPPT
jgi:hypothetical protein